MLATMALRGFEARYAVFVMLHLVAQPSNHITEVSDGRLPAPGVIHQQPRILPDLWQRIYLPLDVARSLHHYAPVRAHFFQEYTGIVRVIGVGGHTTSLTH